MATMVKEKRKEKKKSKDKHASTSKASPLQPSLLETSEDNLFIDSASKSDVNVIEKSTSDGSEILITSEQETSNTKPIEILETEDCTVLQNDQCDNIKVIVEDTKCELNKETNATSEGNITDSNSRIDLKTKCDQEAIGTSYVVNTNELLNLSLGELEISSLNTTANSPEAEVSFEHIDSQTYANEVGNNTLSDLSNLEINLENVTPSAPVFEEVPELIYQEPIVRQEVIPKVKPISIEEAIKLFGGQEIAEVKAMSEREEAIVEAGPVSGPEHPLVDLLSTFRSSLISMERERAQLAVNIAEEENYRNKLWEIEKKYKSVSEKCSCGAYVHLTASYENAKFFKEKLPVAKMKLESILRDIQESFCHHLHSALLAHCQIEELVSETAQGSKSEIREALALILQALRLSAGVTEALAKALQRWAGELSAALVDGRDLTQMLYLIHHLFRQTRSVSWASRIIRHSVNDKVAAAQTIAILDFLLIRIRIDSAKECTEETEEWEEIDKHGSSGAVREGMLRERELVTLVRHMAPRQLVARLLNFNRADIKQTRPSEWLDQSGGSATFRACCGVRVLIATLHRAAFAHVSYTRLRKELADIGVNALKGLAGLHMHNRDTYAPELHLKLTAELEAAFSDGFNLLNPDHLHRLPASLLSASVARDYCVVIMVGLHDKAPKQLDSLPIEMPVLPCQVKVRMVTQAAVDRSYDHELARMVLDFLIQTGLKRKPQSCAGACDVTARECIIEIVKAHTYLHTIAFQLLAELNQGETLDASSVKPLSVETWRPSPGEICAVLDHWSLKCPHLVQHILLDLEYTPHVGIDLETQLAVGSWLCNFCSSTTPAPEWCWAVLRRLSLHTCCWGTYDAPAQAGVPNTVFEMAYSVCATSWGHCVPLICSQGITALTEVARVRARDAIHCLAPVMLVMAQSPQSISFTPGFQQLFAVLLESGPSLMQRAFGRETVTGADMILKLMLTQLDRTRDMGVSKSSLISTWLHALWLPSLPAVGLLDTAMLVNRIWRQLDAHTVAVLQQENAKEILLHAIKNAYQAPIICESSLRCWHAEREGRLWPPLLRALLVQRQRGDKPHVDNALKAIGASITSEDLIIYRAVTAAMLVPMQHPSHLVIWRLFMHLYLQRAPEYVHETFPPIGPLFFSGLIKSRTLSQIKKRLNDTASYHNNEAKTNLDKLQENKTPTLPQTSGNIESPVQKEDDLFPELSIRDLTGESSDSSDESSSEESEIERTGVAQEIETKRDLKNMYSYHVAAEKMCREYLQWLEEGEKTRAVPCQADIARFIPEIALEEAWNQELSRRQPVLPPDFDEFPLPKPVATSLPAKIKTPLDDAIESVLSIKDTSTKRVRRRNIKSPVEDVDFKDMRSLLNLVEKHLTDIERLSKEWSSEVSRLSTLDSQLWELVSKLRVCRPLPPIHKSCPNNCRPIPIVVPVNEWCNSVGAVQGITENRASARACIRRLARPRPHSAKTAAALHTIARRIMYKDAATRVSEVSFRSASSARGPLPAHALTTLFTYLAEKWLCNDGKLVSDLLSRWSRQSLTELQQTLCGGLISPRRMPLKDWPRVYLGLLKLDLPSHAVFSYLSKFEMSRWSESAESGQRLEILEAILKAVQRWGSEPSEEHHILIELLGVHTSQLLTREELCSHVSACSRATVVGTLPALYWGPVTQAAARLTGDINQLGHLLRELGATWWVARSSQSDAAVRRRYAAHAQPVAVLLHTLQRAFVRAGLDLSYTPQRVVVYSWSALIESWSPWISPHSSMTSLLTSHRGDVTAQVTSQHIDMLRHFQDSWHQLTLDAPGTEIYLLQQSFEWVVQTYLAVKSGDCSQECSTQLSAFLEELTKLPWMEHQWFGENSLRIAVQACSFNAPELNVWLCRACGGVSRDTWRHVAENARTLPEILYFLTSIPHQEETIEEARHLYWQFLPEEALDEALDRFFMQYHNPAIPYHELPQFRLFLSATMLSPLPGSQWHSPCSRQRRASFISRWTRAACGPALLTHVAGYCSAVLTAVQGIAPYIQDSDGELEELLSRAVIIMCLESAAAPALTVWQKWVSKCDLRLVASSLTAASALTTFEYFAALSDTAARTYLQLKDSTGWGVISSTLSRSGWNAAALVSRGKLTAAYGRALNETVEDHRHTLQALFNEQLNFIEDELVIAAWICLACRIAQQCSSEGEQGETRAIVVRGAAKWGEERGLLSVIIRGSGYATDKHRLLCRLAQCILSPTDQTTKSYESACSNILGQSNDAISWGKSAQPKRLPRLAIRLYPEAEKYFTEELDLALEH